MYLQYTTLKISKVVLSKKKYAGWKRMKLAV